MGGVKLADGEPANFQPPSLPLYPPAPPLDRWRAEHIHLLLPVITPSFPACAKYDKKSFGKNPNLQFVGRTLPRLTKPSFVSGSRTFVETNYFPVLPSLLTSVKYSRTQNTDFSNNS